MIEKCITIETEKSAYLHRLMGVLIDFFKDKNGIATDFSDDGMFYILTACEKEHLRELELIVANELCEVFVNEYKEAFFHEYVRFGNINIVLKKALLRALVCFDQNTDRQFVLSLDFTLPTINVFSYFMFRTQEMVERWRAIVKLTNENAQSLIKTSSHLELLKYLLKSNQSSTQELNVVLDYEITKLLDMDHNLLMEHTKTTNTAFSSILSTIVSISPQKIKVFANVHSNKLLRLLKRIFDERIDVLPLSSLKLSDASSPYPCQNSVSE